MGIFYGVYRSMVDVHHWVALIFLADTHPGPKNFKFQILAKLFIIHGSVWREFLSFKPPSKPHEPSFHLTMSSMDPLY